MTANNKTIQHKTKQLDELVAWFDSDNFALEEALDVFKRADALAGEIEKDLTELKNEISVVKKRFDTSGV